MNLRKVSRRIADSSLGEVAQKWSSKPREVIKAYDEGMKTETDPDIKSRAKKVLSNLLQDLSYYK
jgi:hypothetical protein